MTIEILRFPLAILVIYIHVDLITTNQFTYITAGSMPVLWGGDFLISKIIAQISVPTFFLFSGLLLFRNGVIVSGEWKMKWKKRISSLLLPYFTWNIIYLFLVAISQFCLPSRIGHSKTIASYDMWDFLLSFISMDYVDNGFGVRPFLIGPIDLPLWFLRDLMVLVMLAPIIQFLLFRLKGLYVLVIVGIWLLGIYKHILFIGTIGLCFFSLGAYLGIKGVGFRSIMRYGKIFIFIFLTCAIARLCINERSCELLEKTTTLFGVFACIAVACHIVNKFNPRVSNIYPKSSFFVYAAHYYLSIFAIRLAISMSPKVELILFFDYLFIPIFLGILLVQAYRLCPVLLRKILAGGR